MQIANLHSWDVTPREAVELQRKLANQVEATTPLDRCELVAGADVSFTRYSPILYAVVVVLRTSDWSVVETQRAVGRSTFPYIPGLLTFREAPLLLSVFAKLQTRPDVVIVDGQGQAHPRRLGIASHLGLWLDLPTIGCGKSKLTGTYREPGPRAGAMTSLCDKKVVIGKVLRTRARANPLFISVGHRIDLASAVRLVRKCCQGYRLPITTRAAHRLVNELRRGTEDSGEPKG